MTDDEHAIRKLIETWMAATRARNLDQVLELMADDVVFMVPGREPFGKEAFAASARALKDVCIEASAEVQELVVLDDWAWSRTRLIMTMTLESGETKNRAGYALTIFRRKTSGAWVVARDANLLVTE